MQARWHILVPITGWLMLVLERPDTSWKTKDLMSHVWFWKPCGRFWLILTDGQFLATPNDHSLFIPISQHPSYGCFCCVHLLQALVGISRLQIKMFYAEYLSLSVIGHWWNKSKIWINESIIYSFPLILKYSSLDLYHRMSRRMNGTLENTVARQ